MIPETGVVSEIPKSIFGPPTFIAVLIATTFFSTGFTYNSETIVSTSVNSFNSVKYFLINPSLSLFVLFLSFNCCIACSATSAVGT